MYEPLVRIAENLDVATALAELALCDDYWVEVAPGSRQINLVGPAGERLMAGSLDQSWTLIDLVHAAAAANHGDCGRISYARIGLMRPGEGVSRHFDGMDGDRERRYQIALQSVPGAEVTVGEQSISFAPGEAWWLDVSRFHSVRNASAADRIVILFDTKA